MIEHRNDMRKCHADDIEVNRRDHGHIVAKGGLMDQCRTGQDDEYQSKAVDNEVGTAF